MSTRVEESLFLIIALMFQQKRMCTLIKSGVLDIYPIKLSQFSILEAIPYFRTWIINYERRTSRRDDAL